MLTANLVVDARFVVVAAAAVLDISSNMSPRSSCFFLAIGSLRCRPVATANGTQGRVMMFHPKATNDKRTALSAGNSGLMARFLKETLGVFIWTGTVHDKLVIVLITREF